MEKKLTGISRVLRKNMTKEERHLWYDFLKGLPLTVNRQKVLGDYIVVFFVASKKLVIELDGSQHFQGVGPARDRERDEWFRANGITVLRYTNLQINREFDAVCQDIMRHLGLAEECPLITASRSFSTLKGEKPPDSRIQKPSP
ncbi:MAG: endonuclease domain-containing protein [Clostridia bacterium]|nr:endonuclease domain-containing protein [Clostridia bacterium]